jgi:hypothetical protein
MQSIQRKCLFLFALASGLMLAGGREASACGRSWFGTGCYVQSCGYSPCYSYQTCYNYQPYSCSTGYTTPTYYTYTTGYTTPTYYTYTTGYTTPMYYTYAPRFVRPAYYTFATTPAAPTYVTYPTGYTYPVAAAQPIYHVAGGPWRWVLRRSFF